ncbi:MAG: ACT domain-containing protein [Merdibacter sp.]
MERKVLSLLVANQFGVLTRVSNLFGQRGFNIDSLAVGERKSAVFLHTITTHGNEAIINQTAAVSCWRTSKRHGDPAGTAVHREVAGQM